MFSSSIALLTAHRWERNASLISNILHAQTQFVAAWTDGGMNSWVFSECCKFIESISNAIIVTTLQTCLCLDSLDQRSGGWEGGTAVKRPTYRHVLSAISHPRRYPPNFVALQAEANIRKSSCIFWPKWGYYDATKMTERINCCRGNPQSSSLEQGSLSCVSTKCYWSR